MIAEKLLGWLQMVGEEMTIKCEEGWYDATGIIAPYYQPNQPNDYPKATELGVKSEDGFVVTFSLTEKMQPNNISELLCGEGRYTVIQCRQLIAGEPVFRARLDRGL